MGAHHRGSSPLARGLRQHRPRGRADARIIPARAGFTAGVHEPVDARPDHPRSRGVYVRGRPVTAAMTGSSPLARGLLPAVGLRSPRTRIIPARAGFTPGPHRLRRRRRDHPRSRGVYQAIDASDATNKGSSPLARGLRAIKGGNQIIRRIIPARAGFTRRGSRRGGRRPDHPRSRGVYPLPPLLQQGPPGSSPLARGLPRRRPGPAGPRRIIPARAGFTNPYKPPGSTPRDHPRSRGVYSPIIVIVR